MTEVSTITLSQKCGDNNKRYLKVSSTALVTGFLRVKCHAKAFFFFFPARSRNSIAVCSMDHLKQQGNKRPHSIISTSSNSSSNSSHSGIGGFNAFGAMNLAFNPMDSPRTYRKSLTFMSTGNYISEGIL